MTTSASELITLAEIGKGIFRLFQGLAAPSVVAQLHPSDTSTLKLINAEGERFKLWAANLGLLVPGHGSLDYRVREAEGLASILKSFLLDLHESIQEVLEFCSSKKISVPHTKYSTSAPQAGGTEEVLVEGSVQIQGEDDNILEVLLDSVQDIVNRLSRVSVQIRNPITRLESSKAQRFQLLDGDVNLFTVFEHYDLDFVRSVFLHYEKVRLHHGLSASSGIDSTASQTAWHPPAKCQLCDQYSSHRVEHEHPQLAQLPEHYLVRRIARANVKRRRQFAYWKHHQLKLLQHTEYHTSRLPTTSQARAARLEAPKSVLQPPSVTTASQLYPLFLTTFDAMSTISVSEYSPTGHSSSDEFVELPEPPTCNTNSQFFECSYCFTTCARKTLEEKAWKAHLIHDLRPYICTFRDCNNPDQLYDRMADWIHHENSHHRTLWSCSEHIEQGFSNARDLEDHYRTVHSSSDQGMLNTKAPPILDVSKDSDSTCPMCSASITSLTALQSHVALHLERLAAFSFPRSIPADEDDGSEAESKDANFDQGSRCDDLEMSSVSGSILEPAQLQDSGSEDETSLPASLRFVSQGVPAAVGLAEASSTIVKGRVRDDDEEALRLEEGKQAGGRSGMEAEEGQSFEPTIFNITRNLLVQITIMREKITILTDYYIYPDPIPTEIQEYDPRLALLTHRLEQLQTLSPSNLEFLIDSWELLIARDVNAIVDQLINAVYGIEKIFVNHYDPSLHERKVFDTIHKVLEHTITQLGDISLRHMPDSQRLMPVDLRPGHDAYFCRGAIEMINDLDSGSIERFERVIRSGEPQAKDDETLKQSEGALLHWCCSSCSFKLRVQTPGAMENSMDAFDEIRTHGGINLGYRPRFLVKSHLNQSTAREYYTVEPSQAPKYGCVFCFSVGKPLQQGTSSDPSTTIFRSAMELAAHTSENHRNPLPPWLLSQKFLVAVKGKAADGERGWDVNFV